MFNKGLKYKKRNTKAYGLVSVCAGIILASSMVSVSADEVSGVGVPDTVVSTSISDTSVSDIGVTADVEVADLSGVTSSLDWESSAVKFDTSSDSVSSSGSVLGVDSSVPAVSNDSTVVNDVPVVNVGVVDSADSVDTVQPFSNRTVVDSSNPSSEIVETRRSIDEDTVLLNKVTNQISDVSRLSSELSQTLKELSLAKSLEADSIAKYNESKAKLGSEVDSLRSSLESAQAELNKVKGSEVINFELVHDPVSEMDASQRAVLASSSSGNVAILEKSDSKPTDVYIPLTEEQYNSIKSGSGFIYTPNRDAYIKHMVQNIKDIRAVNGIDIDLPPLADDAMDYAQRRAEELADLGRLDGHKAERYSAETKKSRSGENIGLSSLLESKYLKYSKTSGLSDEELAYVNFYSYMSEYNNVRKGGFGHAKNILTLATTRGTGIGLTYRDVTGDDGFKRRDFYNTLDGYSKDGLAGISVSDYRNKFLPQVGKLGVATLADGSFQYQFDGKPVKFIGRKVFHYTYNKGVDTAKVSELSSKVTDLTSKLGVATSKLSELEKSYKSSGSGVSGIEARVSSLRSQLNSYNLGELVAQKGRLESTLSANKSKLVKLEDSLKAEAEAKAKATAKPTVKPTAKPTIKVKPTTSADITKMVLSIIKGYPRSSSNSLARPVVMLKR